MSVLLIAGVLAGVYVGIVALQRSRRRQVFAATAARRGLTVDTDRGPARARGTVGAHAVWVGEVHRGSGRKRRVHCRIEVTPHARLPDGLYIAREGLGTRLAKAVGLEDIQVGNTPLDAAALIRGEDPEHIRQLLCDDVLCLTLERLVLDGGAVSGGSVSMELPDFDDEHIDRAIRQLGDVATDLTRAVEQPWMDLADREGMDLSGSSAAGVVGLGIDAPDGTRAVVRGDLRTGRAVFEVTPAGGLADGLVIVAGEHPEAVQTGDVLLDGRVSLLGARPEAIRALVRQEGVREELLAVFTTSPASRVSDGVVRVEATAASFDVLSDRLHDAVRLADALSPDAQ
jgi:hypothetical protein